MLTRDLFAVANLHFWFIGQSQTAAAGTAIPAISGYR